MSKTNTPQAFGLVEFVFKALICFEKEYIIRKIIL
jgi:hypothetical protein